MDDEWRDERRGCGCLGTTALLAIVGLIAAGIGFAVASGLIGLPSSLDRAQLPSAITRAAEQLGSTVATSARALSAMPAGHAAENLLQLTHPHIVLSAGRAVKAPTQHFSFDGVKYSITPHVASNVYWGARRSTRLLAQPPGETSVEWTNVYYNDFAGDPAQRPALEDVIAQLRAIRSKANLTSDQYLEMIAKYVQSIPYDWPSYSSGTGKQRFPVETLVDGKGLCGDKSVLLADLLSHEGYAVALLDFGPEKHMAVGVQGPGKQYASAGYLFLETTAPCYITDVPTQYSGGMTLRSDPVVVPIGAGTTQYGSADEIGKIVAVRDSAQRAADRLYASAKKQSLTEAQVTVVNRKLDEAYRAQTSLRSNVVDRAGKSVGTFLDRTVALTWIDRNAWWM